MKHTISDHELNPRPDKGPQTTTLYVIFTRRYDAWNSSIVGIFNAAEPSIDAWASPTAIFSGTEACIHVTDAGIHTQSVVSVSGKEKRHGVQELESFRW